MDRFFRGIGSANHLYFGEKYFGIKHDYFGHKNSAYELPENQNNREEEKEGKNASGHTDNPKTDIVVAIAGILVVAVRRTAITRIIVPRAAAFRLPIPPQRYLNSICPRKSPIVNG